MCARGRQVFFYLITSNSSLFYLAFNGDPCRPTSLDDLNNITSQCTGAATQLINSLIDYPS